VHGLYVREEVLMRAPQAEGWTRRRFLRGITVAGTAGLVGLHARTVAAEPPPETKKLTLALTNSICHAPQSVAQALFDGEGFTAVDYRRDAYGGIEA
jgi:hypothetical protein